MHFFKSVLVGASAFFSVAVAQANLLNDVTQAATSAVGGAAQDVTSNAVGITQALSDVTAGKDIDVHYKAAHINMPVKITLRKGDANDLKTISTLTNVAVGGVYHWKPANNLVSADDYALEIKQGSETNYYGPFSIAGVKLPAYPGSSPSATASTTGTPKPYLPNPASNVVNLPLVTASGSPAPEATTESYSFTASGTGGLGGYGNITVQGTATGTGNIGPTKTTLTYISPTITPGSQVTVTAPAASQTGAASTMNINLGLALGIFGLFAYLN